MAKRWYVVHAYSGYEKKVMLALGERIALRKMEDYFDEVLVPTEEVVEMRGGQKTCIQQRYSYCAKTRKNNILRFYSVVTQISNMEENVIEHSTINLFFSPIWL